jgi:methionyl-tRNA synthetase
VHRFNLPELKWGQLKLGTRLGEVQPVFPRADKFTVEKMQKLEDTHQDGGAAAAEKPAAASAAASPGTIEPQTASPMTPPRAAPDRISVEDFAKIELRAGQVKVAEKVKGADKLLRLEVDLGTELRQVVAGIAEAYAPETLIGRQVVIVANLAPRKLRGLESNGMILAASPDGGKPILCSFLENVPPGTKLK